MRNILLPLLLLTATAAQAQDCAPAKLLASVPMHSAEPDSNIRTVPVTLNGTTRHMILDTGGAITQLSRETTEELQLPLYDSGTAVYDINGRVSRRFAVVDEFTLGHLNRKAAALMVWSEPRRPYDVDVDFGAGLLRMYAKNYCPGPQDWSPTVRTTMHNKS